MTTEFEAAIPINEKQAPTMKPIYIPAIIVKVTCANYPEYLGRIRPKCGCIDCWIAYLRKQRSKYDDEGSV